MREGNPEALEPIIANLHNLRPASRLQLLGNVQRILGAGLEDIIDTHNTESAIFVFNESGDRYALKIEFGENTATQREAGWYQNVPATVRDKTPAVFATKEHGPIGFVLLGYIENAYTIDELVYGAEVDASSITTHLQTAMSTDLLIFGAAGPAVSMRDEVDANFMRKYADRLRQSEQYPYLKKLLGEKALSINGIPVPTPSFYVTAIQNYPAVRRYLTPEMVGMIHGDLHGGNILAQGERAFLLDPKGKARLPLTYDYGKLLHTVHGGYGMIMQQRYQYHKFGDSEYYLNLQMPEVYTDFYGEIRHTLTDRVLEQSLYAEALHFATMLPHHAKEPEETTVLLVRCMQLFSELFDRLGLADHE